MAAPPDLIDASLIAPLSDGCAAVLDSTAASAALLDVPITVAQALPIPHAAPPQELIVWSAEHETMVLPSGEKATERTQSLCALCFSALSSRDAATSTGAVRFGLRGQGCQC